MWTGRIDENQLSTVEKSQSRNWKDPNNREFSNCTNDCSCRRKFQFAKFISCFQLWEIVLHLQEELRNLRRKGELRIKCELEELMRINYRKLKRVDWKHSRIEKNRKSINQKGAKSPMITYVKWSFISCPWLHPFYVFLNSKRERLISIHPKEPNKFMFQIVK